jgi:hypothetical protein
MGTVSATSIGMAGRSQAGPGAIGGIAPRLQSWAPDMGWQLDSFRPSVTITKRGSKNLGVKWRNSAMSPLMLKEQTQQWLNDPLLGDGDADAKIRRLLEAEYLRKMAHYQRVRQQLEQKYGISFQEFVATDVVAQRNYSWEVEQDAMHWETAIGGIETVRRRLLEIQDTARG